MAKTTRSMDSIDRRARNTGEFVRLKSGEYELLTDVHNVDEITFDDLGLVDEVDTKNPVWEYLGKNLRGLSFVDANLLAGSDNAANDTYNVRCASQLNRNELEQRLQRIQQREAFLDSINYRTTSDAQSEFRNYCEIIQQRREWLERPVEYPTRRQSVYKQNSSKLTLFSSSVETAWDRYTKNEALIYEPENSDFFDQILAGVVTVADFTESKRKLFLEKGPLKESGAAKDGRVETQTDEMLVSMALYNSLVHAQPTNILTCDGDIQKMVSGMYHMLARSDEFSDVVEHLHRYPVRVYFIGEKELFFDRAFDTSDPKKQPNFCKNRHFEQYEIDAMEGSVFFMNEMFNDRYKLRRTA